MDHSSMEQLLGFLRRAAGLDFPKQRVCSWPWIWFVNMLFFYKILAVNLEWLGYKLVTSIRNDAALLQLN